MPRPQPRVSARDDDAVSTCVQSGHFHRVDDCHVPVTGQSSDDGRSPQNTFLLGIESRYTTTRSRYKDHWVPNKITACPLSRHWRFIQHEGIFFVPSMHRNVSIRSAKPQTLLQVLLA